jgi:uncharacterized OB-fold protein
MAFCNSCGASIAPGTSFCNKCGAAIVGSAPPVASSPAVFSSSSVPPSPSTAPPVPPGSGGGALKAVLIIVGVVVLVGALGVTALAFLAVRMAHRTRVHQEGDSVKVETPFGTVQTTKDPQEAARNLGVDLYPGAQVSQAGAASATIGGIHTVALNLETSDSVDQVCSFYKPRFANAMATSTDPNQCTIVSNDHKNMISINARAENGRTRIVITNVSKSGAGSSSSN